MGVQWDNYPNMPESTEITYRMMIAFLFVAIVILLTVGLVTHIQVEHINKNNRNNGVPLDSGKRIGYDAGGGSGVGSNGSGDLPCTVDEMLTAVANNEPWFCDRLLVALNK